MVHPRHEVVKIVAIKKNTPSSALSTKRQLLKRSCPNGTYIFLLEYKENRDDSHVCTWRVRIVKVKSVGTKE